MPSRQERRTADRDAAKAAKAGSAAAAAAATAAAAALASVRMYAGGDWTTQKECPLFLRHALGDDVVQRRAGEGDRQGFTLALVHFSAQPEPCLTQKTPLKPPTLPNTPQHLLNTRKITPQQPLDKLLSHTKRSR